MSAPKPPPRQPPPKQPKPARRSGFTPEFLAECAGYTLAAQLAAGCPAPQVRPERETCPAEAVEYMKLIRSEHDETLTLVLDVNQDGGGSDRGVFRTGKYTGAIRRSSAFVKEGWRVEGYIWTEGKYVVGRYTKLFPSAGAKDANGDPLPREVPVCIVLGNNGGAEKEEGSKPGAVVLRRAEVARYIHGEWPQP